MFKITQNRGFHMTFENGFTVSVQFGASNYCDNRYTTSLKSECFTAECAVWDINGKWYRPKDWSDDVNGYMTTDQVAELIAMVQSLEKIKQ